MSKYKVIINYIHSSSSNTFRPTEFVCDHYGTIENSTYVFKRVFENGKAETIYIPVRAVNSIIIKEL